MRKKIFSEEIEKKIISIEQQIEALQKGNKIIYPRKDERLKSLMICRQDKVRVLILGQDPYHGPNQANGLAFSVNSNTPLPPSLKNIFKELKSDIGCTIEDGDLSFWASQGVALVNTILSVEQNAPLSHKNLGWQDVVSCWIRSLLQLKKPLVICLWGKEAAKFFSTLENDLCDLHLVLRSNHPSPLSASRGFFGSRPFSKINTFLEQQGLTPINWCK